MCRWWQAKKENIFYDLKVLDACYLGLRNRADMNWFQLWCGNGVFCVLALEF